MADKLIPSKDDTGAMRRFRDMGDGTFAEVLSVAAGAAGAAGYPAGATPVAATASGANAVQTVTLPAAAGKTTYITSLQVSGGGATAAALASATLSGVLGGSESLFVGVPAGAALAVQPLVVNFNPALPGSAVNTAIACALSAFGAGNVVQSVSVQGYQL